MSPLVLGEVAHLVNLASAQDHPVAVAADISIIVVALNVAVEGVEQRVLVQRREVIRLTERVHRQFPIARRVVRVAVDRDHRGEVPSRELVIEPRAE